MKRPATPSPVPSEKGSNMDAITLLNVFVLLLHFGLRIYSGARDPAYARSIPGRGEIVPAPPARGRLTNVLSVQQHTTRAITRASTTTRRVTTIRFHHVLSDIAVNDSKWRKLDLA